jgi:hypothetical protein
MANDEILHKPQSILRAVGIEPAAPRPLQLVPILHFQADLFNVAPGPRIPTVSTRVTSPAVAAQRSVIELVPLEGEVRIHTAQIRVECELVFSQSTLIQANETSEPLGSTLNEAATLRLLRGDRTGSGVTNGAYFTAQTLREWLRIPAGWRVAFVGAADNTAITIDFVLEEFSAHLQRVEGA